MRAFHSSVKSWPPTENASTKAGESPLSTTMLQLFPTAARLQTLAWPVQSVTLRPPTASSIEDMTKTAQPLTHAMWNHRKGPKRSIPRLSADNSPSHSQKYGEKVSAQLAEKSSNHKQMARGNTQTRQQWDQMQQFYANTSFWPPATTQTSTQLEGGSPLLWTGLYPREGAWSQTYSWDGHLENYMPWNISPMPRVTTRPPLISHAMWNIRRGVSSPVTPPTDNPYRTRLGVTQRINPVTTARGIWNSTPQLATPLRNTSLRAAVLIYLFLDQQSSGAESVTLPLMKPSAKCRYWKHQCQSQPTTIKSQKSCIWWTTAIIQRLWDTAWDLLTYRNIENKALRVWPTLRSIGNYNRSTSGAQIQHYLMAYVPSVL